LLEAVGVQEKSLRRVRAGSVNKITKMAKEACLKAGADQWLKAEQGRD
jgi:nicotinamide mononucleotide (NMN) deamidase PncC